MIYDAKLRHQTVESTHVANPTFPRVKLSSQLTAHYKPYLKEVLHAYVLSF